jgi:hypothetical protein
LDASFGTGTGGSRDTTGVITAAVAMLAGARILGQISQEAEHD